MIGMLFNYFVIALFLWAIVDAASRPKDAFPWAGTMGKWAWVALLLGGLALRAGLLPFRIPGSFLACFVLVIYYLGTVKPKLDDIPRRGRTDRGSW